MSNEENARTFEGVLTRYSEEPNTNGHIFNQMSVTHFPKILIIYLNAEDSFGSNPNKAVGVAKILKTPIEGDVKARITIHDELALGKLRFEKNVFVSCSYQGKFREGGKIVKEATLQGAFLSDSHTAKDILPLVEWEEING